MWCYNYLGEWALNPFTTIRNWLHEFSVAAKNMPRPSIAYWDAEGKEITISGKKVILSEWTNYVRQKLHDVSKFVESNVLMGVLSLDEIDTLYDLPNLKATNVLGEGILFDATNPTFDNPESLSFLAKLLEQKKLGAHIHTGPNDSRKIAFDKNMAIQWIIDIHRVWQIVQPLAYILQGPGGRLTEECTYSPINNEIGPANIIIASAEGTGGFYSRYHKSLSITGQFKHIIRLVPYQVFRMLYILVRIVRPIELGVLYDYIVPFDQHQATTDAYKNHLFASYGRAWTPEFSSAALLSFTQKSELGFAMGVRELRHFSIAIQRKKLNYTKAPQQDDTIGAQMRAAADAMAAHTSAVAEYHYARLEGMMGTASQDELFMRISRDWHQVVYEIPTSKYTKLNQPLLKPIDRPFVATNSPVKLPRVYKPSIKNNSKSKKINRVNRISQALAAETHQEQRSRRNIAKINYKDLEDGDDTSD